MFENSLEIKKLLDEQIVLRNNSFELSYDKPDPLLVAKRYKSDYIMLVCALFAYGNAKQIVKFLDSIDFNFLEFSEEKIEKEFKNHYYRFQNSNDVIAFFKTLKRLQNIDSLENIFFGEYKKDNLVLEGIDKLIHTINKVANYQSQGFNFLISNPFKRDKKGFIKEIGNAPYKRWNMLLRWLVRKDNLDLGLWQKVDKKDLILPLDTHTFNVSLKLNLLTRQTYDLKSALLITEKLRDFDKFDPIKYDFALYRIGQEKILSNT